jgi:hypothetical protein
MMAKVDLKRRACQRFYVPGASLSYRIHRFLLHDKDCSKDFCPALALAKGGVGFLTNHQLGRRRRLSMLLTFSAEEEPIRLEGRVVYCIPAPVTSHRYQVGVAFAPFSPEKGHNSLEALRTLERLEKIYGTPGTPTA